MFLTKEGIRVLRERLAEFSDRGALGQIFSRIELTDLLDTAEAAVTTKLSPIPITLWCPNCGARHVDVGEFATKPHHTHACQECGLTWRPAIVDTVGVQFLPGFKNGAP